MSTLSAFKSLGVSISDNPDTLVIKGNGLAGLSEPNSKIDCGNSGTTMRLLCGLLSGLPFSSTLTGDASLRNRPMRRVIAPLTQMGATISALENNTKAPISITGGELNAITYNSPVSSAQVKSSIMLAGLSASGVTSVIEPEKSRDHTELMLSAIGAKVTVDGLKVSITGGDSLEATQYNVPNDFSSAAFFIAGGLLIPGAEIKINAVGINPTRTGLLSVLKRMGANVQLINERSVSGEPVADIIAKHSTLSATVIAPNELPAMIDEFPIFCILAAHASGTSTVSGAAELRVKESDRISAMATGLKAMGATVAEADDSISIEGKEKLSGARIDSYNDHRIAMSFAIAALRAEGETEIVGEESVNISFPGFFELLESVTK